MNQQHAGTGLQRIVVDELLWDPRIDASNVVVSADGDTVTLAGSVHSYSEKCRAEALARRVRGVVEVKNALEVRLTIGDYRTDATLERLATDILESLPAMLPERPRVTVRDGWLTLDGVVGSAPQKRTIENAFLHVAGIRGLTNRINIIPRSKDAEAKRAFEKAVLRSAALTVADLSAEVAGATIVIRGTVGSCVEHDALLDLAWCAPGIARVEDRIVVRPRMDERVDAK